MRRLYYFACIVALGVFAPTALAQNASDPASKQYDAPIPVQTDGGEDNFLGSLPFTGMDLLIVTGVAILLMGAGLALRSLSRISGQ